MFKLISKFFLKYFWNLHIGKIKKNIRFKNIHKGQTCYIIGNGASLKYHDISKLPKKETIATTYSLFDTRISKIKPNYYVIPDQYNFYPIIHNERLKHEEGKKIPFSFNYKAKLFKKIIFENSDTNFFISITNFYSFTKTLENLYYLPLKSFIKNKTSNNSSFDLSNDFDYLDGSLDVMIGIAKYMGFSKAILLGCDYLGQPKVDGHFYSDEEPFFGEKVYSSYLERIKKASKGIELLLIFKEGVTSSIFNSKSFFEFSGHKEEYKNNYDIISHHNLNLLREAADNKQLFMKSVKNEE